MRVASQTTASAAVSERAAVRQTDALRGGIIVHHMENVVRVGSEIDYPAQTPSGERGGGGQMRMRLIYGRPAELLQCTTGRIGTRTAWPGRKFVAVRQRRRSLCGAAENSVAVRQDVGLVAPQQFDVVGTVHARVTYSVTL